MAQSLTEWGLAFAVAHDLEVRPGNSGEVGPPRGFSLHVRGLEHGQLFRYDPEGKPEALLTWLPLADEQMNPVRDLIEDPIRGFAAISVPFPPYLTRRWRGGDRAPLATVLEHLVAVTQDLAIPDLPR